MKRRKLDAMLESNGMQNHFLYSTYDLFANPEPKLMIRAKW